MRTLVLCVGVFLGSVTAEAACVELVASTVPRHLRTQVAYALAFKAGRNEVPTDGQGLQPGQSALHAICFDSFDPTGIITDVAMAAEFTAQEAERAAADVVEQTRLKALRDEISANPVCRATFAQIDTAIDNAATTADLKIILKRLAKCVVAFRALGFQDD